MKRLSPVLTICAVLAGLLLCAPGVLAADGTGVDGRDQPDNLSGPRRPDIESVAVSYSGADVAATVKLVEPWAQTSKAYPYVDLELSRSVAHYGCSPGAAGNFRFGADNLDPNDNTTPPNGTINGIDGVIRGTRTFSDDGLSTTFSFSHPELAGRGYLCGTNISIYYPDGDGHCSPSLSNCQHILYRYTGDTVNAFFFDGMTPVRPACDDGVDNDGDGLIDYPYDRGCVSQIAGDETNPVCMDRVDNDGDAVTDWPSDPGCSDARATTEGPPPAACANLRDDDGDGKVDLDDPGCRANAAAGSEVDPEPVASKLKLAARRSGCRIVAAATVGPSLRPVKLFAPAKVSITVRGRGGRARSYRSARRVASGTRARTAALTAGRYTVSAVYAGDRYRKKSKTVTAAATLPARCSH